MSNPRGDDQTGDDQTGDDEATGDDTFTVHEPAESADKTAREVNENQGDDAASGGGS